MLGLQFNYIDVVDISLSENTPKVTEVLEVLSQFYSVEKMIIANETKMHNPSTFEGIKNIFKEKGKGSACESQRA